MFRDVAATGVADRIEIQFLEKNINSEACSSYEQNSRSLTDPVMVVLRDSIANSIWGDNN